MKRTLLCLAVIAATTCLGFTADEKKLLHGALAIDKETPPATSFAPDVPQIYAFYIGDSVKTGDKLRAVWIAEDVGDAAPKGTKVDESTLTADRDNPQGAFSLSKPAKGWPLGRYKVEIYDNDKLAETLRFTIVEENDEDDSDAD